MSIVIKSDSQPKVMEGLGLYLNVGWGEAKDYTDLVPIFEKAYKNSLFITAYDQDKLVGMIRYLSDGFHDTQIVECLVLKNYQRQGIAKSMLNRLKQMYPTSSIYLQCTESYQEIFVNEGFKKHKLVGMSYFKRS